MINLLIKDPIVCEECGKLFASTFQLREHVSILHLYVSLFYSPSGKKKNVGNSDEKGSSNVIFAVRSLEEEEVRGTVEQEGGWVTVSV